MVNVDMSYGIRNIWKTDFEFQSDVLHGILKNIRNISDPLVSERHFNYLKNMGAFYVHSDSYISDNFGDAIKEPKYGIYNSEGQCYLAGRLAIPLLYFDGTVRGFVGYAKKPEDHSPEDVFIKYLYPHKYAFDKGRYFFMTPEEFEKAVNDQYICIVDGIFDKIILQCLGINAVSLCGSSLTIWHQRYLSFIKHKIVVADNDIAGRRLSRFCRSILENCVEIIQTSTGDIDSLLRTENDIKNFNKVFNEMKSEGFLISKILPVVKPQKGDYNNESSKRKNNT